MGDDGREIMDALAEKTRYAILEGLTKKSMSGDEIAEYVKKARSTVESHLSLLLRLQLVTRTLRDRTYYYDATDLAKSWLEKASNAANPASDLQINEGKSLVSKSASSDYRTKYAWIYVPIILGSLYVLLNAYVYPNIHIIIPALFLGSMAAMLNHPFRILLRSIMIASVTVAIVAGIVLFEFSLYAIGLLFSVSFIFILMGGVASWYMTKLMKRKLKA